MADLKTMLIASGALLALLSLSCAKQPGEPPPSPWASGQGQVTATSAAAAPAPSLAPAEDPLRPALVRTTRTLPTISPTLGPTLVETPAPPPTPAVLDAVEVARGKLEPLAASLEGTRVRFIDCNEAASCTARLEARSLTGLRDLLSAVSRTEGGIGFVAREQLDAFTGRTFVADVSLGGENARAVPSDENALLGD
jgi:hypothetical protein